MKIDRKKFTAENSSYERPFPEILQGAVDTLAPSQFSFDVFHVSTWDPTPYWKFESWPSPRLDWKSASSRVHFRHSCLMQYFILYSSYTSSIVCALVFPLKFETEWSKNWSRGLVCTRPSFEFQGKDVCTTDKTWCTIGARMIDYRTFFIKSSMWAKYLLAAPTVLRRRSYAQMRKHNRAQTVKTWFMREH